MTGYTLVWHDGCRTQPLVAAGGAIDARTSLTPRLPFSGKEKHLKDTAGQINFLFEKVFTSKPIAFRREFIPVAESAAGALFLSQLYFWKDKGSDIDGWIYKSREEWTKETGLTRYEQEAARRVLCSKGILEEKKLGMPYRLHFRVNLTNLISCLSNEYWQSVENSQQDGKLVENSQQDGCQTTNQLVENNQLYKEAKNTTENTTKNTIPTVFILTSTDNSKNQNDLPDWLPLKEWDEWKQDRKTRRIPVTPMAQKKALNKLTELRAEGHNPAEVLTEAVIRGWRGLFPVNHFNSKTQVNHPVQPVELEDDLAKQRRKEAERKKNFAAKGGTQ